MAIDKNYIEGDVKTVIRFAYIPTKIKLKWIWLKHYKEIYKYKLINIKVCEGVGKYEECYDTESHYEWILINKKII